MYSLLRTIRRDRAWLSELPAFTGALVLTEVGCKLHSFTLECGVFLGLWWALSTVLRRVGRRQAAEVAP